LWSILCQAPLRLPVRRKKALLFEKRSKNFCLLVRAVRQRLSVMIKSFLVLFSKKNCLLSAAW
jgi:hypothetical protein